MDKDDHAFAVYLARGSNLSQRYRAEALEKPSQALDSEILTAARRTTMSLPELVVRPWYKRWQIPLSIAVVFFFGIGVTLRTVMQEAKLSKPASVPQENRVPPATPAVASPHEQSAAGAVNGPAQPSVPDVIMGGGMASAPTDAIAKTAPDLQSADMPSAGPSVSDKLSAEQAAKPAPFPAAPPAEKDDSMRSARPMPEAARSKAAGEDAVESKAGSGPSGHSLKKESPGVLSDRREPAPSLGQSNDAAAVPDAVLSMPKRDQAAPQAAEAEKRATPPPAAAPQPELPSSTLRSDSKPQAIDAPRLPEGHRPIVDGKTFRSSEANPVPPAKESEATSSVVVEDQTEPPEVWLKRIAELRRMGKGDEADTQLKRLRGRYPDFPVPEDK